MALLAILVGATVSFGPFATCSERPTDIQKPWGEVLTIPLSTGPVLKFGYVEEPEPDQRTSYGYYVSAKRTGVWITCSPDGKDTDRTVFRDGIEIGPRELLHLGDLVSTDYFDSNHVVIRTTHDAAKHLTISASIDSDLASGTRITQTDGILQATTTVSSFIDDREIGVTAVFDRGGRMIGKTLSNGATSLALSGSLQPGYRIAEATADDGQSLGYPAVVAPFFSKLYTAPYPGRYIISPGHAPTLDDDYLLPYQLRQKTLWQTGLGQTFFDIVPDNNNLLFALSAVQDEPILLPLKSPDQRCLPQRLRNDSSSGVITAATAVALGLYSPDRLVDFVSGRPLTPRELNILRWSNDLVIDWSNERISQQFLDELRAMEGQMWNSVSDVNCRRSMIYFGEYRLLSPSLLGNLPTVANTKMYIELAKQPPSPEEAAFVLNTYSENDSNVRQAVSDWLQCIGELSCNSEGRFQISVRAWYAASAFGIQPATIDAGYYPAAFDSAAVLQGQEALTAFWIDRFFSQYAEELRKGKKLRIAFLHRIQAVVQSNALWASRAQILLKVPWDRQQGVQERDYRRLLQTAVLVDPNSPDRTHIEDWTMKMEYVGNATPVAYQMDYAVAGGATDQFLQIVSALIDAADREIDDDALATSLEPRQLMANALLAGTPAEVLEVTRRTAKTNTVVRAGQPLFTYVSDDIFKVSFRVPKSHPLASFPLGSPVSIALVPSDKNTIAVQVCDTDLQYCRDPSQLESAVQLSRLVFATSLSAAVVEGGNFVVLEFIIKCGERCRSMASPRTASPADDHSAASPLSLLRVYSEAQDPNGLFFSNNLLKSRGPWTVVPSWQQ